jgi:acidic leucine-rich nuclear phosphoprotein 32 family protein A/C/D
LILDDCRSTAIVGLTDEYVGLRSLSLINVGLTSLKGFPKLPLLLYVSYKINNDDKYIIDDNYISFIIVF